MSQALFTTLTLQFLLCAVLNLCNVACNRLFLLTISTSSVHAPSNKQKI